MTRSPDLSLGSFVEIFRYDRTSTTSVSVSSTIGVDSISVTDLAPLAGKAFYRFEAISP